MTGSPGGCRAADCACPWQCSRPSIQWPFAAPRRSRQGSCSAPPPRSTARRRNAGGLVSLRRPQQHPPGRAGCANSAGRPGRKKPQGDFLTRPRQQSACPRAAPSMSAPAPRDRTIQSHSAAAVPLACPPRSEPSTPPTRILAWFLDWRRPRLRAPAPSPGPGPFARTVPQSPNLRQNS